MFGFLVASIYSEKMMVKLELFAGNQAYTKALIDASYLGVDLIMLPNGS